MRLRRKESRGRQSLAGLVKIGYAANLDVAARGEFESLAGGEIGQFRELRRADPPAGQPNPHERTVGRLMRSQYARAGVGLLSDQSSSTTGGRVITWPA